METNPFVRAFDYGKNREGYWSAADLVKQIEDQLDVLHALYGDEFQFLFLFDHI